MANPRPLCGDGEVRFEPTSYADFYTGTREALIAGGKCDPSWFPKELETDRQGRVKRTYHAQGKDGLGVTLTHRLDSKGRDYWVAQFDLPEQEAAARRDKVQEERKNIEREHALANEEEVKRALPVVTALRKRYPDVRIEGRIASGGHGDCQSIWFVASPAVLMAHGLITRDMTQEDRRAEWGGFKGSMGLGQRYVVTSHDGKRWQLAIFTDTTPMAAVSDLKEARRLIRDLATKVKRG